MEMIIDADRMEELEKAEWKLRALEKAGVREWDGYDCAIKEMRKNERIEEIYTRFIEEFKSEVLVYLDNVDKPTKREGNRWNAHLTYGGKKYLENMLKQFVLDIQETEV